MGGIGAGAMGAVYDMLNEDKRRAVEIIVEHKAAATDPERAREELPAFYTTMGFTEKGTTPFLKGHRLKQPVHLILMSKSLA